MLVQGGLVHDGLGKTFAADVRVECGRISEVGTGLVVNPGEEVVDARGLHVLPGFCQAISSHGVNGTPNEIRPSAYDNDETSDPVHPELDAFYAFNGRAARHQQLGRFGITSVGVAPTDNTLFGGMVAAFEVDGVNPYRMVLARDCAMMASVYGDHLRATFGKKGKAPQTRMWVYANLAEWLRRAEAYDPKPAEKPDDKLAALARVTSGEVPLWVACDSATAIAHVRAICARFPRLRLVLVNGYGLTADDTWVIDEHVPVIVRPGSYPLDKPSRSLDLSAVASLVQAGARVVLGGENANSLNCREDMLWCSAMLMRELHDGDAVLPCVTSAAVAVLGLSDTTGAVKAGLRADLALWSDDPLETFQARLVRTYQAGRVIYQEGEEHTWL